VPDASGAEWPLIEHHLREIVCDGDYALYEWLLNWCASLVQQPGVHANTAIMLQGGQGTGKGFFAHDLLGGLFDSRHYLKIANSDQFYHRFAGELLSGRCLVFLDEATWGGDKRQAGMLKDYITGDTFIVDRKGISACSEVSMLHLILASNEDWPVGVDRDDRRFVAFKLSDEHANDPVYFEPLYTELRSGGQAAFLRDMLAWTIDAQKLRLPPNTKQKTRLKQRSMGSDADWWFGCLNQGRILESDKSWPKDVAKQALHNAYLQEMQKVKANRPLSTIWFWIRLREWCPSIKIWRVKNGPRQCQFPTLDVARREFEAYLKTPIDWEDADLQPQTSNF
jgi:phage/plasmid-associated DNA primase